MRSPQSRVITAVAASAAAVIVLPVFALLYRVPWHRLNAVLTQADVVAAMKLSLVTSVLCAACSVVLGVPLAWWLICGGRLTVWVRPLVTAPLVLPPTVAGLALLALMGRRGMAGSRIYEATGWSLPFSTAAVVVAGVFVGMPFLVMTVESAFANLEQDSLDAAQVDGAGPLRVFWDVALPQIRRAVVTGGVLSWARALGEFGATLTFAGSLPGVTRTLPMQVYVAMDSDPAAAYAMGGLMIAVSVIVLAVLRSAASAVIARR